jgi:hypothetical protein
MVVLVIVVLVVDYYYLLQRHHQNFAVGFHRSHLCYHRSTSTPSGSTSTPPASQHQQGVCWSICEGNGELPTIFPNSTSTPWDSTTMVTRIVQ